jgi:ribonuclease Z
MTTTVTITGTGCPIPDPHRAGPGVLVRYGDLTLQFDVGRATVPRLAAADVWIPELGAVFVTHHHSDHLTGLTDLLLTRWVMRRDTATPTLPVIVPAGPAEQLVASLLDPWRDDLAARKAHTGRVDDPDYTVVPFAVTDTVTEVWRHDDVVVKAGPVRHQPLHPAVGYRVETPDGVVAITGDTLVCDEVGELVRGADVVVYEAMRFPPIEALPEHRRFILDYHADTRLIGAQMAELEIPTLMLTHLIPPPSTDAERQAFVDDIRNAGYQGALMVADDLEAVQLGS